MGARSATREDRPGQRMVKRKGRTSAKDSVGKVAKEGVLDCAHLDDPLIYDGRDAVLSYRFEANFRRGVTRSLASVGWLVAAGWMPSTKRTKWSRSRSELCMFGHTRQALVAC